MLCSLRSAFLSAAIALAALGATAIPALAQMQLLMFQQDGCPWCARWNAQIGPIYPKTTEGKEAPLTRLDIHAPLPTGIALARRPQFTPTFVLVRDGKEIGRIEGYPGADFFWGLLDGMLTTAAPAQPVPAKS
ncbi:MAG: hypothetical protein KGN33_17940 [Paracoccaceae bacterium]|nr:hypothetical protein [Paracoccaceae bacterium]